MIVSTAQWDLHKDPTVHCMFQILKKERFGKFNTKETKKIEPSQSGVDNTTPGMYPVIYEAKNK